MVQAVSAVSPRTRRIGSKGEMGECKMPVEKFRSREAYRKNLAYRHMHGIPFNAKDVVVAGKKHAVKHSGRKADRKRRSGRR